MSCENCEGELRGFIELHKMPDGWSVRSFLPGRDCVPESVVSTGDDEPYDALTFAAWELTAQMRKEAAND